VYPKYKCLNCGRIWHSKEIMVVCPVCRCKGIKIRDGVDVNEVVKKIKCDDPKREKNGFKKRKD